MKGFIDVNNSATLDFNFSEVVGEGRKETKEKHILNIQRDDDDDDVPAVNSFTFAFVSILSLRFTISSRSTLCSE
jgi:hypothetical protein